MPKGAGRWAGEVCILIESGPMACTVPADGPSALAQHGSVADETLLDTLAALTPEERLRWNDRMATTVQELRHGFAAAELDHLARPPRGERD